MTEKLYQKYYYSRPGHTGGTVPFYNLCRERIKSGSSILEVGAGPENDASKFFASLGPLTGLDVSDEVLGNKSLTNAAVYDGGVFPFPNESFDAVVSNMVLEHVDRPEIHFSEVWRVLKPDGIYCFRTINLHHYMAMGSKLVPRSLHVFVSRRLRKMAPEDHDPWPTVYRANTIRRLTQLCENFGFSSFEVQTIEPEPSYGRASAFLFYPMMIYERAVNSTSLLRRFRIVLNGVARK